MSEVGIATGVISLIEKSFAAYRAVAAAKEFGSNAAQQVMMLRFEAFRYGEWAQDNKNIAAIFQVAEADLAARPDRLAVGLVGEGKPISPATALHEALCDAVTQVIDILASVDEILAKYGRAFATLEQPDLERSGAGASALVVDDRNTTSMGKSQRRYGDLKEALQSKTSFPRRVKYGIQTWNDADKETLKGLIERFKYWNDNLYELAPPSRSRLVELKLSSQIVAAASTQEELQSIQTAASESNYESVSRSAILKKKVNEGVGQGSELHYEYVQLDAKVAQKRRVITNYYPNGLYLPSTLPGLADAAPQRAMVEWYYYDTKWNDRQVAIANRRVENLASVFSVPMKPDNMPVLDCFGWIKHPAKNDRALVYKVPNSSGYDAESMQPPATLYEALSQNPSSTNRQPPTLAERFSLASALAVGFLELHTVDWLHKGFDSNSVLLFPLSETAIQYSKPFIASFDFARPDRPGEESLSMRPSKFDIYRHPELRAIKPSRESLKASASRMHDAYSLGLVLFEIGMWTPLETYLKPNLTPEGFRKRIQGYASRDLALYMGPRYNKAVQACLSGAYLEISQAISLGDGEDELEQEDESVERSALTEDHSRVHQLAYFYRHVVAELSGCQCGMADDR